MFDALSEPPRPNEAMRRIPRSPRVSRHNEPDRCSFARRTAIVVHDGSRTTDADRRTFTRFTNETAAG
jgi:hypothetical protein